MLELFFLVLLTQSQFIWVLAFSLGFAIAASLERIGAYLVLVGLCVIAYGVWKLIHPEKPV